MFEILKKAGVAAGLATVIVLAITFVPIYYQYHFTKKQNERIQALEQRVEALAAKSKE